MDWQLISEYQPQDREVIALWDGAIISFDAKLSDGGWHERIHDSEWLLMNPQPTHFMRITGPGMIRYSAAMP